MQKRAYLGLGFLLALGIVIIGLMSGSGNQAMAQTIVPLATATPRPAATPTPRAVATPAPIKAQVPAQKPGAAPAQAPKPAAKAPAQAPKPAAAPARAGAAPAQAPAALPRTGGASLPIGTLALAGSMVVGLGFATRRFFRS